MNEINFDLTIPLDQDGFIELECDYCNTRFMIIGNDFKNGDFVHLYCPICGLPNRLNTFYTSEVINKTYEIATELAMDYIQKSLGATVKKVNNNKSLKMELKVPQSKPNKELYKPANSYVFSHLSCCDFNMKVRLIDEQIGPYCPKCGGCNI